MRVVLLNQYYAPDEAATAQLLADVGEGLVEAGHEVIAICCARSYDDPSHRYSSTDMVKGVRVNRTWVSGFGRRSRLGRTVDYATFLAGAALRLALQRKPDVVLSLSTPPLVAGLGWLLAHLRGARSVYWVMDVYPDVAFELGALQRGALAARILDRMSRFILERSDRVVALGEWMATHLSRNRSGNVDVIHNWADGEGIRPKPDAENALRRRWGWDGRFVVLYSGNLGLAHEFDTVLAAAELLRGRPEILFAFVGGGPRRAEIQQEAERRQLPNVEFRPYVRRDQLGDSLTAGDLHLVTLREKLAGLLVSSKIYGILAAGRPTVYVGPQDGEVAEIVSTGPCGSCVRNGDAESLAEAILNYRLDPSRVDTEGRRARELFERRFTKRRGIEEFVNLVESTAV